MDQIGKANSILFRLCYLELIFNADDWREPLVMHVRFFLSFKLIQINW